MGMALAIIGLIVAAVLMGVAALVLKSGGPSDDEIFRRFDALTGFTITERHAHDGSGLAADEMRGLIAVQGKGREKLALLGPRDLVSWKYVRKDDVFEMTLKSRRHADPFLITFRRSATADEWLKIFKKVVEEHG